MASTKEEEFYLAEYKSLREEITAKLKDRLEFNRWGLLGLATLYSYIFSHLEMRALFWVPVGLSAAMIAHMLEEHRMVAKAGRYIEDQIESWVAGSRTSQPQGWETYLTSSRSTPTPSTWSWSPVPLWSVLCLATLAMAISGYFEIWP
jgi:hypothetical protein